MTKRKSTTLGLGKSRDISGIKFHRLTALYFYERDKRNDPVWWCRCECGVEKAVSSACLIRGNTKSCGCLARDLPNKGRPKVHGMIYTPTYRSWVSMKTRCKDSALSNPKNRCYKNISVCERWNSFENFYADMGERPSTKHSLDRFPNPQGNYEPGNCRWATSTEQNRNHTGQRLYEWNGFSRCLSEWSEATGIKRCTLHVRINRLGWSLEKAFTYPVKTDCK